MFSKLLVANRGEIACRVIRTARRMGVATVAVFSEADRNARHVEMADEALPIGPAPARESYLRIDAIVAAARQSGAEAVHPGYGFLSENADFAEACAAAGITFIGPPPASIRAMGSKSAAKALMEKAGVPLVPGYHGDQQDPALLAEAAARIGYPVLIKASAGGGGKGMRVVEAPDAFADALALAQGEARASFGDDRVLIERYLTRPRHIEMQVFADRHGRVVHLFERDCSIQRRHQKVVEEAPAPGMSPERRAEMGRAACEAAAAIGYEGAGTVEFIVDTGDAGEEDGAFYFMEMNTRLQVEHPVTEMITGQDLVEWQLRVAAGEPLPLRQDELAINGHAIEVRLYAEDPARDYRPSTGTLLHLRPPPEGPHVRVETGVGEGDAIGIHYDPMIAKLIAWDVDRPAAVRRLRAALQQYEVAGVVTNLGLLRGIAAHPAFLAAELDTGFLGRHPDLLAQGGDAPPALALAAATAHLLAARAQAARALAANGGDPHSPWTAANAWRLNGAGYQEFSLNAGGTEYTLRAHPRPDGSFQLETGFETLDVARLGRDMIALNGARRRAPVVGSSDTIWAVVDGTSWSLSVIDKLAAPLAAGSLDDRLVAPMPGRVVAVQAELGAEVRKGDVLLVLEAMKVQMRLTAPRDGRITSIGARPGDLVEEGVELVGFAETVQG